MFAPLIGIYHEGTVVRLPPQSPGGRDCLCVYFLSFGLLMLLYVSPGPTRYISYAYGTISLWPICAEIAVKHPRITRTA